MCISKLKLMGYQYGQIDGISFNKLYQFLHQDLLEDKDVQKMFRKHYKQKDEDAWKEYLEYEKNQQTQTNY